MVPRKGVLGGGDPVCTWWTSLCRAVDIFSSRSGSAWLLPAVAAAVRGDEGCLCFGAARASGLGDAALPIAAEHRGSCSCRDRLVGGSATCSGLAGRLRMPRDSAGSSVVVVPGDAEAAVAIASLSLRRSLSLQLAAAALSAFST